MGAVVRLTDPDKYRGNVKFAFDVTNATVLVNGTRVLCNPRGYAKDGVSENAAFEAGLMVEIH